MAEDGRVPADDLHSMIERARQAQEREPVRFVIEPVDADAEAALLGEAHQLVIEGVLVEIKPRRLVCPAV
jgi:hypothetical protein